MKIQTRRLLVTDLKTDMISDIQKNSLDEDNRRFVPDEVFETYEDAEETVNWLIESYNNSEGPFLYPIITKDSINIGYVQACKIPEGWEIGYHIAKQFTGKGYATEALNAFLPVIADKLKVNELYGVVLEGNLASHKVLEKNNFVLEYKGKGLYQGKETPLRRYKFSIS